MAKQFNGREKGKDEAHNKPHVEIDSISPSLHNWFLSMKPVRRESEGGKNCGREKRHMETDRTFAFERKTRALKSLLPPRTVCELLPSLREEDEEVAKILNSLSSAP